MTFSVAHVEFQMARSDETRRGAVAAFCAHIRSRGFAPRHIFDVGANRGDWSRAARSAFPGSRFTLIEPQIELREYLERFCAETEGARWINAGAGGFDGHANFTICADSVSSSFLITCEESAQQRWPQRTVPIITLDSVCRDACMPPPDLVKVDVEGFEHEVLKGATTLIGKTELFLLEMTFFASHRGAREFTEMVAIMASHGYLLYDFVTFERRACDNSLQLCEAAFARAGGRLRPQHSY